MNLCIFLFNFSDIRSNLDPFLLYTDTQIWDGLRRSMLGTSINSLDDLGNQMHLFFHFTFFFSFISFPFLSFCFPFLFFHFFISSFYFLIFIYSLISKDFNIDSFNLNILTFFSLQNSPVLL